MKVLLLAPHPFYQERGTPLAVDLLVRVLAELRVDVDVLTYHVGKHVSYDHVTIHRIPNLPFIRNIRPGFSWEKVICDCFMFFKAIQLVIRHHYHWIHAVEESVFTAVVLKWVFRIPYTYDMDSSLGQQLIEQRPFLRHFEPVFDWFEAMAVRNANVVAPVCDALSAGIEKYRPGKVVLLHDVPAAHGPNSHDEIPLKAALGVDGLVIMYVGNLEAYQGIDLLLESFALVLNKTDRAELVIIGGEMSDIEKYQTKAEALSIHHKTHFLGPKPIEDLSGLLAQADILVSPRIKGNNTPMKLYSYLESGKGIVATDLPTHTQILDGKSAKLAQPIPVAFSEGLLALIEDASLRVQLGTAGKLLVKDKFNQTSYRVAVRSLVDWLERSVNEHHMVLAKRR
jgi:glycosyltransferase involved in cell wall biosynthesis